MSRPGARSEGEGRTGGAGRATSMPPEKHLGLASYLPELSLPPSSMNGSNNGSISGSKRKTIESGNQGLPIVVSGSSSSAAKNDQECSTQRPTTQESQQQQQQVVNIDGDEGKGDAVVGTVKRVKRCTSHVWEHFTKKIEIVEIDGKK